jgi:hypothetical protein
MPRPRTGDTRKMVTLPTELAEAIEEYRFENRIKTEAEAIRRLIAAGVKSLYPTSALKLKAGKKLR